MLETGDICMFGTLKSRARALDTLLTLCNEAVRWGLAVPPPPSILINTAAQLFLAHIDLVDKRPILERQLIQWHHLTVSIRTFLALSTSSSPKLPIKPAIPELPSLSSWLSCAPPMQPATSRTRTSATGGKPSSYTMASNPPR